MDVYRKLGQARVNLEALVHVMHYDPGSERYVVDRLALAAHGGPSTVDALIAQAMDAIDAARADLRVRAAEKADRRDADR